MHYLLRISKPHHRSYNICALPSSFFHVSDAAYSFEDVDKRLFRDPMEQYEGGINVPFLPNRVSLCY
jgi:hypothetical protein